MGKVFYLYNTHFGTNGDPNGCPELVDGTNCNNCGDYICDTPADPKIAFNNVNPLTCVYEPNPNDNIPDVDANGDPYRPDTSNIMSYSLPSCWEAFTPQQVLQMKNALGFLPHLQNTYLQDYIYIRPDIDCYSCNEQPKTFKVYSSYDLSSLYPISSTNIETEIIEQTSEYLTIKVTNLIGSGEGEPGNFSIVRSGRGIIETTQHIWVGLPQTIPDNTFTGNETAFAGQSMFHSIENRINGIEFYGWDVPEPSQIIWGGEPVNNELWSHFGYDKYFLFTHGNSGNQTGLVRPYGINPCGEGEYGENNEICVVNSDDPEGDTECNPLPYPIIYYPNPADSLLQIDLSLQDYKIYTVVIYDENQTVKYSDQTTNIVKTVDVFNLTNGTYYLHIYDDNNDNILSRILIINH